MIKFILPKGFFNFRPLALARQHSQSFFQSKSKINILVFSFTTYKNKNDKEKDQEKYSVQNNNKNNNSKNHEANPKSKKYLFEANKSKQYKSSTQNRLNNTNVLQNKLKKKWSQNINFHNNNENHITKKDDKNQFQSLPEKIQENIKSKSETLTFLSQSKSLKPKLKWEQKYKPKSQNQIFLKFQDENKIQNSFNNMNQKRQNYKYSFNVNQSLRTNIIKCQTSQALSTIFKDYKKYFNSKIYAVAGKKLVNCFKAEITQSRTTQQKQQQKRKTLQRLTPLIESFLSLDPIQGNKYQFHTEQIKSFLYIVRKLKPQFLEYYPQNKQKLQKLIMSLKKRLVQLVQQFQVLELITIQSDLMRIDLQLQSQQIYNQFLNKKQTYVLNYYSFTNFIFCLSYLEEHSKNNQKTMLDRRNQCFQFMIVQAIKKDKLIRFQHLINVQNFYSYLENILKFKHGVPSILKLQIANKIFESIIKVALNVNQSRQYQIQFNFRRLISHFCNNLECFSKLLLIFALIQKKGITEEPSTTIKSWLRIQNNAISRLNSDKKKTLQCFLLQYSNKMKNQNYITQKQFIEIKQFSKNIC